MIKPWPEWAAPFKKPIPPHGSSSAPKVLITRLSAHGDVLQTLPLLATLKHRHPTLFIGWVVEASAAPLLENNPLIDQLHVLGWKEVTCRQKNLKGLWAKGKAFHHTIQHIQATEYDIALDVQGLLKSALIPFLANIPVRMGYAETREGAARFYTHQIPKHELHHPHLPAMQVFLRFLEYFPESFKPLASPKSAATTAAFYSPESLDTEAFYPENLYPLPVLSEKPICLSAQIAFPPNGLSQSEDSAIPRVTTMPWPVVAVAPATLWNSKHWPPAYWCQIIAHLQTKQVHVVVLGSPSDRQLVDTILQNIPPLEAPLKGTLLNLAGQTSWTELRAILEEVHLFIGPDSAPLHLANAIAYNHPQTFPRILGLFGPTAPGRTGPIEKNTFLNGLTGDSTGNFHKTQVAGVECQPCFKKICPLKTDACMNMLLPDQVIATLENMLSSIRLSLKEEKILPEPSSQTSL